jgi:hypothetical protein
MGGAPSITWVRAGVGFEPAAAASFRRAEASWGSPIGVNSSYREYLKQLSMWAAYQDYIAGRGPYPGHGFALHPDASMHCRGLAFDSDDWTRPGFVEHMAEHGWIRTALHIEEWWHFDRQPWRDKHINDPAPAYSGGVPFEEEDMPTAEEIAKAVWSFQMPATSEGTPYASEKEDAGRRLRRGVDRASRAAVYGRESLVESRAVGSAVQVMAALLADQTGVSATDILARVEKGAREGAAAALTDEVADAIAERVAAGQLDADGVKAALRDVFMEAFTGDGGDSGS